MGLSGTPGYLGKPGAIGLPGSQGSFGPKVSVMGGKKRIHLSLKLFFSCPKLHSSTCYLLAKYC